MPSRRGYRRKRRGTFRKRRASSKKTSYKRGRRGGTFWKRPTRYTARKLYPDQTRVVFRTTAAWEPITDVTGGQSFAVQALWLGDPFGSFSTTLQPTGLDQYAGFYNKYIVTGCSVSIQATTPSQPTDFEDMTYTLHPSANAAYSESSYATRYPYEIPYQKSTTVMFKATRPSYVRHYCSSKKMFGQFSITNPNYHGTFTSAGFTNPVDTWFFNVRAWNAFNPVTVTSGRAVITIRQYATLFNRVDIQNSVQ